MKHTACIFQRKGYFGVFFGVLKTLIKFKGTNKTADDLVETDYLEFDRQILTILLEVVGAVAVSPEVPG